MGKRIRQRTVYAATIVAVLSLVAGFAIASITTFNLSPTSQGSGSTNTAATAYTCATTCLQSTLTTGSTTAAACTNSPTASTVTGSSPTYTITLTVASSGTTCKGGDFAEEFSFTSNFVVTSAPGCFVTSPPCSDAFLVSSVVSGSASNAELGTAAFSENTITPPTGSVTIDVNVVVDYGAGANPGITSISLVANGNY